VRIDINLLVFCSIDLSTVNIEYYSQDTFFKHGQYRREMKMVGMSLIWTVFSDLEYQKRI
jgi:hypothetical protein